MAGAQSVQGLVEFIRTLGAARLGAMAAVTAALIGMFGFIILRVTAPQMSPVFTDLTPEDSAAIVKDLERQGIAYELKNDGAIVMVPRDKMTRIRMKLAEGGLPKGGGVGYEIFDKSDTLGATSFVQNKQMPPQSDPVQQKMLTYFMPAMFTVFMLVLPAGLGIYMFTNGLIAIVQQRIVEYYVKRHVGGAGGDTGPKGAPPKSDQQPPSKKGSAKAAE